MAASLSDGYSRALAPLPQAAAALAPAISGVRRLSQQRPHPSLICTSQGQLPHTIYSANQPTNKQTNKQTTIHSVKGIDGEAELGELHRVALDTGSAAEALAARQAHAIEDASSDLFCSPEILRQGPMEIWEARGGSWLAAHCVLTRAGFVHWFKNMEDPEALDVLNLGESWVLLGVGLERRLGGIVLGWEVVSNTIHRVCIHQTQAHNTHAPLTAPTGRCQFEQGKAPVFNLVESSGGAMSWLGGHSRKVTFQAPSVEECCEWASECLGDSLSGRALGRGSSWQRHWRVGRKTAECVSNPISTSSNPIQSNPVALREGISLAVNGDASPSGGASNRRSHSGMTSL